MSNRSSATQFLLLAFSDTRELQLLHFWLFLGIYLAALLGNGLIITTIACEQHLHTPMYFFLLNLSLLDLGVISTVVPKSMANSLWGTRTISYAGCAAQVFFFFFFITAEFYLLTAMCYDRYVAICLPLRYGTLLRGGACARMAAGVWGAGLLNAAANAANTFSLPLCRGHRVGQFFCEVPQILRLSCPRARPREAGLVLFGASLFIVCFAFMVASYARILAAVLRVPAGQARLKAFSTCVPHLAVLVLFIGTAASAYLRPPSASSPPLDLPMAVLYSVLPPALNPLIYGVRNRELRDGLRRALRRRRPRGARGAQGPGVPQCSRNFHP